ncbi:unnamed protein product [Orchesella dallaii]|uniref:Transmembrane protein n=1 Tax=Orchesella dallaii TaxID=48710 RepID=A0ABP1QG81_9HEXA
MSPNPSDSEVPSTASTISTLLSSTARPSLAKLPTAGPNPMPPGVTPSTVTTISSAFTKSTTSVPPKAASFDHIFEEPLQPAKVQANLTGSKSIPSISSKKSKVIKRPPPIRTLEHHHHHHPISVDSKTDFKTKKVDENKVNYLPYHPPVAVDQTGLIQSIGKPFNPNNAKYLPDPGDEFMITRRASEVRLKHVKLYGDVNSTIVDGLVATLKLFSVLIGISGFLFFVYVLGVSVLWTPMEFVRYFLDAHPFYKVVYIVGVVQPMAVAPYCRYALLNLKFIRTVHD